MLKVFFLILFFVTGSVLYGQNEPKSTEGKTTDKVKIESGTVKEKFMDKDGDGINDNIETKRGNRLGNKFGAGKGKDLFIDEDGDGICDNRANGIGFGAKGKGKMNGKRFGRLNILQK